MKKLFCLLFLILLAAMPAWAQDDSEAPITPHEVQALKNAAVPKAAPAPDTELPVGSFTPDHLDGTWAFGFGNYTNVGNVVTARHWLSPNLAIDVLAGGGVYSGAAASSGNPNTTSLWNYGLGVGLRKNIARPVSDVYFQLLAVLSFSQNFQKDTVYVPNNNQVSTNQNESLNLFVGPGFEAFLPFFKNLSIEANVGLNLTSSWASGSGIYTANGWNWQVSLGSENGTFSIVNAAVHFYF